MYVSGTFVVFKKLGNFEKGAYAIYMASRKCSYNLYDAKVTIKCDHTPLQ